MFLAGKPILQSHAPSISRSSEYARNGKQRSVFQDERDFAYCVGAQWVAWQKLAVLMKHDVSVPADVEKEIEISVVDVLLDRRNEDDTIPR